jgi:hypothetical protein
MGWMAGEFNSISGGRGRDFYLCDPIFTSDGLLSYEYVTRGLFQGVKQPGLHASHSPSYSTEDYETQELCFHMKSSACSRF